MGGVLEQVVVLKKDLKAGVDRKFSMTENKDGTFTLVEIGTDKQKTISESTFKKSYKRLETEASATPAPEQPIQPIMDLSKYAGSDLLRNKKDGSIHVEVLNETKYHLMNVATGEQSVITVSERNNYYEGIDINGKPIEYQPVEDDLPETFNVLTRDVGEATEGTTGSVQPSEGLVGPDGKQDAKETPKETPETAMGSDTPQPKTWSLLPKYERPDAQQKPLLQSQGAHALENSNSMRANRDSRAGSQPFTPKNGNYKLRQSMLSSYLQCPSKFYETYENGYNESSIFTRVGTAIHGVMEDYYNDPQNADVVALFEQWWRDHGDADPQWYEEWRGHVVNYFKRHAERNYKIIALEFEWQTTINGIECSGTIDRIDRIDEKTIRIVDYKTNFQQFTTEDLNNSTQFMFYTLALQQMKDIIGDFEHVQCDYEMLRLGLTQSVTFTKERLDEFALWLDMMNDKILAGNDRAPRMNKFCGYCERRHKCDLYQDIITSPNPPILTEIANLESIAEQREQLKALEKVIKGRADEIDTMIKQKILENGGEVVIGEYKWSTKAGTRQSYNPEKVIQSLALMGKADIIPKIVSISSTALKFNLSKDKEILDALETAKDTSYISPSINKSKIKK